MKGVSPKGSIPFELDEIKFVKLNPDGTRVIEFKKVVENEAFPERWEWIVHFDSRKDFSVNIAAFEKVFSRLKGSKVPGDWISEGERDILTFRIAVPLEDESFKNRNLSKTRTEVLKLFKKVKDKPVDESFKSRKKS